MAGQPYNRFTALKRSLRCKLARCLKFQLTIRPMPSHVATATCAASSPYFAGTTFAAR